MEHLLEMGRERLIELIERQNKEIEELEQRPTREDMKEAMQVESDKIIELEAKLEKKKAEFEVSENLKAQVIARIEELRPVALKCYKEARGIKYQTDEDDEYHRTRKMINSCTSIETLENFIKSQRFELGKGFNLDFEDDASDADVNDGAVVGGSIGYLGEPGMNY